MKKTALFYLVVLLCLLPAILLRDYTPSNELRYRSIADEALREHFAPDKGKMMALLTFGYPDQEPKMPKRREGRYEIIS